MNEKLKLGLAFVGAIVVPYLYYTLVRPKLLAMEDKFDQKVTQISDRDLEIMKKKMQEMKRNRGTENNQYSNNDNKH